MLNTLEKLHRMFHPGLQFLPFLMLLACVSLGHPSTLPVHFEDQFQPPTYTKVHTQYSSKAFFYTVDPETHEAFLLFSIKNSKKSKKNLRYEFLGGKKDSSDTSPVDSLIRELNEEELSSQLATMVHSFPSLREHPILLKRKLIFLYAIKLSLKTPEERSSLLSQLKPFPEESHGLAWISVGQALDFIDDNKFTKQTQKIMQIIFKEH